MNISISGLFCLYFANLHPVMGLGQIQRDFGDAVCRIEAEVLGDDLDLIVSGDGGRLLGVKQV